jgi:hypothetical protein
MGMVGLPATVAFRSRPAGSGWGRSSLAAMPATAAQAGNRARLCRGCREDIGRSLVLPCTANRATHRARPHGWRNLQTRTQESKSRSDSHITTGILGIGLYHREPMVKSNGLPLAAASKRCRKAP